MKRQTKKALLEKKIPGQRFRLMKKEVTIFYKSESLSPIENVLVLVEGVESIFVEENYHPSPSIPYQVVKMESHGGIQFVSSSWMKDWKNH